jgi:acyl-coenzyme A synthetase/AMP-(fatty) acid ligase/aryl carrier-like protein
MVRSYGPTETSVAVLAMKHVTLSTEVSNIGHPLGRNIIYVLDERLRLVPLGCSGELFIGGPQVARCYLNSPKQTTSAFVSDPFRPGSTIYATGDIVRMNPLDGSITYLGRRDTQIKINGLRVEVGEIEQVLKATSDAFANVAVVKVDIGHDSLFAFIECPTGSNETTEPALIRDDTHGALFSLPKHAIRQKLPSYMAPTSYVAFSRFPLTTLGKLDRNTLSAFYHVHQEKIRLANVVLASARVPAVKALAPAETRIMNLWQTVLSLKENIHIDDTFASLGGDSISMMRVSGLTYKKKIPLTITEQWAKPTIREQAKLVQVK